MATVKTILPPQLAPKQLRVAAYCRASSGSDEQQHSLTAQVQYYTELVQQHPDWELVDIYADEGISGTGTQRREEFRRLMCDCAGGKIDRILTKSVSRFARNTVDCLTAVRQLSAMGVSILFEKEQIDSAKMNGEILLAMSGIQAQEESTSISNNMRWSYEKRMKSGDFISCHAAYGFTLDGSSLTPDAETAEIVREIYRLYLSGVNRTQIAERMNQLHIPCRHGAKKWHPSTIRYILMNEKNAGNALLQKTYTPRNTPCQSVRNHGQVRQYYVENSHEGIVSQEDYDKTLYRLTHNNRAARAKPDYSLTHLLFCPDCGASFRRVGGSNAYWICAKRNAERSACKPIRVDEEDVIAAIRRVFTILQAHSGDILAKALADLEKVQAKLGGTGQKVYALDCEIAALTRKLHKIATMQTAGILDPSDFTVQTGAVNSKLSSLRRQRCRILQQSENAGGLSRLRETCDTISGMDSAEATETQTIRSLIERIAVVSDTELEIHLRGGLIIPEHLPEKKRRCSRV